MTTAQAFDKWMPDGGACVTIAQRTLLYAEAADELGELYPCTANAGVDGSGFEDASDKANWRHAVGAMAAALFLVTPQGRQSLSSTTVENSTETGSGETQCDPKTIGKTTTKTSAMDAASIAQAAREDAAKYAARISCVSTAASVAPLPMFALAGHRRSRSCGREE